MNELLTSELFIYLLGAAFLTTGTAIAVAICDYFAFAKRHHEISLDLWRYIDKRK